MTPTPVTDPRPLLDLFARHRHVHVYGIADVVQLWDDSTWHRDGDAVVGILSLPSCDDVRTVPPEVLRRRRP